MSVQKIIKLTPPSLLHENIDHKITCIRAHRERIFQVSWQQHGNKLIFHNYGQGGAGWTFLFGCVHESIRQFEQIVKDNVRLKNQPITVVGAGCYGLLTAILLKRKGYTVRIIAKETENIPSNKAAGFFFPRPRKCSNEQERAIFALRGIESYTTYLAIVRGEHPFIKTGPKIVPAYFGLDIDPEFGLYIDQGLIKKPEKVFIDFGNGHGCEVMAYEIIFINSASIMEELWRTFHALKIPLEQREIFSFDELNDSIVFNCSGLGAKTLTDDKRIVPVQGHLITLKNQPSLKDLQYMIHVKVVQRNPQGKNRTELIYFAPKHEGILGITFIRGQDSEVTNQHEFERLLERSRAFFGS